MILVYPWLKKNIKGVLAKEAGFQIVAEANVDL